MKLISASSTVNQGSFRLDLNNSFKGQIGLVEFNLPNINQQDHDENSIEITCDQIDSNYDNPQRILKNICFNRCQKPENYNRWTAKFIEFCDVDSTDTFLTFRVKRAVGGKPIRFNKSVNEENPKIFYTLAFQPIKNDECKWITI